MSEIRFRKQRVQMERRVGSCTDFNYQDGKRFFVSFLPLFLIQMLYFSDVLKIILTGSFNVLFSHFLQICLFFFLNDR